MYDADLASVYDQVYLERGKDHAAEVDFVMDEIRRRRPRVTSILDVACGTGLHLRHFADYATVEGLELSAEMQAAAARRAPELTIHLGDMRRFSLGRRFDAITCMFSSIGHMADEEELRAALAAMAAHLAPGGVIAIEPWWFPETFVSGFVRGEVSTSNGRTVARVSHSVREGSHSRVRVHFTVADLEGIRTFADEHLITLFTRTAYERAFRSAGLAVDYLFDGPTDRGLFVGVAPA